MNILITDVTDIKWYRTKDPLKNEDLRLIEKQIPFILPKEFIKLLSISDGGRLSYHFDYYDIESKDIRGSGVSIVYSAAEDTYKCDLINYYYNPPEGFPKNLVAFSGDGDQICFDYRLDAKTDNPPIVYWNFESPEGEDISPLADNFMDFLKMLREYKEGE